MLRAMAQAAEIIRDARRQGGLSQVELGRRAGVTQSVVSAYESGRRQPSFVTLQTLVQAAGRQLDVTVRDARASGAGFHGPVGERLGRHRRDIVAIANRYGITNVRVFGSVVRGEDRKDSDIDLLVDVPPGMGLFGLARCARDLEALLGTHVDLVPADSLKPALAVSALADAQPV